MGVALPPMGRLSRGPEGPPSVLPQAPAENRTPRCADSGWLDSAARGLRRGATLPPLQHCIDPPLSSLYPPVYRARASRRDRSLCARRGDHIDPERGSLRGPSEEARHLPVCQHSRTPLALRVACFCACCSTTTTNNFAAYVLSSLPFLPLCGGSLAPWATSVDPAPTLLSLAGSLRFPGAGLAPRFLVLPLFSRLAPVAFLLVSHGRRRIGATQEVGASREVGFEPSSSGRWRHAASPVWRASHRRDAGGWL